MTSKKPYTTPQLFQVELNPEQAIYPLAVSQAPVSQMAGTAHAMRAAMDARTARG